MSFKKLEAQGALRHALPPHLPAYITSKPNCRSRNLITRLNHVTRPNPNFCRRSSYHPDIPQHDPTTIHHRPPLPNAVTMVSLAPYVLKRPWLTKMLTPMANWYANAAGYRQMGLR